jgi:hypothetical protein
MHKLTEMEFNSALDRHPDSLAMTWFFIRSTGLKVQRLMQDTLYPPPILPVGAKQDFPYVLAESVSQLNTNTDSRELPLAQGKIQNLRLACRRIHQRILSPGQTFSFWRHVGPPWRVRGFVQGREVREGCVIPTFGGGLCQLSGSLLEVALLLDLELMEKHRHTALPADVPKDLGRDATIFWNYVDLRFRSRMPILFECSLTGTALVVRACGSRLESTRVHSVTADLERVASPPPSALQSCFTCNQKDCLRHIGEPPADARAAFLLDEYQPEFADLVRGRKKDEDQVLLPFLSAGGWRSIVGAQHDVRFSSWFRIRRALMLRRAVSRGVTVAKAHFELAGVLAKLYERWISHSVEHVYVTQNVLPYLWRAGVLGGRTFDVLMQRLPVASLERQLDLAASLYPNSKTLVEFRAPGWFADAEQEALNAARTIFTPHSQIAALHDRAVRLPWSKPAATKNGSCAEKDLILFVGPTLARKGAYEVRAAVRKTGTPLAVFGPDLEEQGFWHDVPIVRPDPKIMPWERIHTVVQPALIEYWPRQLLRAHAAGANLVITPQCGLEEDREGRIFHVPFGDADQLAEILNTLIGRRGGMLAKSHSGARS